MSRKSTASVVIGAILVALVVVAGGLGYFSQTGQFGPSTTGATMSDQRDATVSNDIANHKK